MRRVFLLLVAVRLRAAGQRPRAAGVPEPMCSVQGWAWRHRARPERAAWPEHSWPPRQGLPLPPPRCGTAPRSRHRGLWERLWQSAFSRRCLISQGRTTLNCNLGRTKEGNTSRISFFITSCVTEGFYPAVVESFVLLSDIGGAKQPRWQSGRMVQPTSARKLVPHPAVADLALMIHAFLAPASGLLLPL